MPSEQKNAQTAGNLIIQQPVRVSSAMYYIGSQTLLNALHQNASSLEKNNDSSVKSLCARNTDSCL